MAGLRLDPRDAGADPTTDRRPNDRRDVAIDDRLTVRLSNAPALGAGTERLMPTPSRRTRSSVHQLDRRASDRATDALVRCLGRIAIRFEKLCRSGLACCPGIGSGVNRECPPVAEQAVEDWIRCARDGDEAAFSSLYERFLPALRRLAIRRTPDLDTAEDCLQEAMCSAWRALQRFEGGADDLAGWLARIVINACIDRARRSARRPPTVSLMMELDDGPVERWLESAGPSPEEAVLQRERRDAVDRAVACIEEPFRSVLELDQCGYSYGEMAEVLDVPLGTVRSRLSRARSRARALLGSESGLVACRHPRAA